MRAARYALGLLMLAGSAVLVADVHASHLLSAVRDELRACGHVVVLLGATLALCGLSPEAA